MLNYKSYYNRILILEEYSIKLINSLIAKFKEETNGDVSHEEIRKYIERFDRLKNSKKITQKDITKYTYNELKNTINYNFVSNDKQEISADSRKIYQKNNISIYEAENQQHCVIISSNEQWCTSRTDLSNMYDKYRFMPSEPHFYFIKNDNLPSSDSWSFFVLMCLSNGRYGLTTRYKNPNFNGSQEYSWQEVVKHVPAISELKHIFKPLPHTDEELEILNVIRNKIYDDDLMGELGSLEMVNRYIGFGHELSQKQYENMPLDLRMKYINMGMGFLSYTDISFVSKKELSRYFVVRDKNNWQVKLNKVRTLPENFFIPERTIGADIGWELLLAGCKTIEGDLTFPKFVKTIDLSSLSNISSKVTLPEIISNDLFLSSLTSLPENFVFPKEIGGYLNLTNLSHLPENITFPENIGKLFIRNESLKKEFNERMESNR